MPRWSLLRRRPMSEKVTHWTLEELADIRARQAVDQRAAWARDERGHPIPVPQRWEGHICPEYEHCLLCVNEAWDCSAAVAFGLMGMAEAIREREAAKRYSTLMSYVAADDPYEDRGHGNG
jgi:hypothetical protein